MASILESLKKYKNKLISDLDNLEKQIFETEGNYLEETHSYGNIYIYITSYIGNIVKGWEGYQSKQRSGGFMTKKSRFPIEDRIFSKSSMSSPFRTEEQQIDLFDLGIKKKGTNLISKSNKVGGEGKTTKVKSKQKKKSRGTKRLKTNIEFNMSGINLESPSGSFQGERRFGDGGSIDFSQEIDNSMGSLD